MRRLLISSVLAAFLAILTGCGDGDKKSTVPTKDSAAPAPKKDKGGVQKAEPQ